MVSKELDDMAPCQKVHRTAGTTTSGGSQHVCAHQSEVMDPSLWSTLPEDLLAHVFAHLPMAQIFTIGSLSKAWSAIVMTKSFKRICAEARPKSLGILGFCRRVGQRAGQFQLAAFDLEYSKWQYHELKQLPKEYRRVAEYKRGAITKHGAIYAQDGGLVCFVSTKDLSVLVCNPLTNAWKRLPFLSKDPYRGQVLMVQLLTDPATGAYKVMLVCRHGGTRVPGLNINILNRGGAASIFESAEAYDSTTRVWNTMTSGGFPNNGPYEVSELKVELTSQQDSPGVISEVNRIHFTVDASPVIMFACNGFILLIADNSDKNTGEYHQRVSLYDTCKREWQELPVLNAVYTVEKVANHFMCELRWDVLP